MLCVHRPWQKHVKNWSCDKGGKDNEFGYIIIIVIIIIKYFKYVNTTLNPEYNFKPRVVLFEATAGSFHK